MPTIDAIVSAVALEFGVTKGEILSNRRNAPIAHARAIAVSLSRELTDLPAADIAQEFGRRRSTIYSLIERSGQLLRRSASYRTKREAVIRSLQHPEP